MIKTVLAFTQHSGEGGGELGSFPYVHYNVIEVIAQLLLIKQ
jgi:hypothetical protein